MFTEDDTFRKLRQPPYNEMVRIKEIWFNNRKDTRSFEQLLKDNYWTKDEWKIFMDEDDTIRRLKRPSYNEMNPIIKIWKSDDKDKRPFPQLLKDNHWSLKEYLYEKYD